MTNTKPAIRYEITIRVNSDSPDSLPESLKHDTVLSTMCLRSTAHGDVMLVEISDGMYDVEAFEDALDCDDEIVTYTIASR